MKPRERKQPPHCPKCASTRVHQLSKLKSVKGQFKGGVEFELTLHKPRDLRYCDSCQHIWFVCRKMGLPGSRNPNYGQRAPTIICRGCGRMRKNKANLKCSACVQRERRIKRRKK